MVKAIGRAFRWRKLLETDTHTTVAEIAAVEKINSSYVGRVLRLTLLSPEIVEAISGLGCAVFRNSFGKSHAGGQARLLASDVFFAESIHCPAGSRPISNVCSIARGHKASESWQLSLLQFGDQA
jgi:hypothetical protein